MLENLKKLERIEKEEKKLQLERYALQKEKESLNKEKQQLLKIKEILEEKEPKVDVSNVFIFQEDGVSQIVRKKVEPIIGSSFNGQGPLVNAYKSTLTNIFNDELVFEKHSMDLIKEKELIIDRDDHHYAYIFPIYKVEPNLLAYPDKQVPLYVLFQVYYNLNNVDVNDKILRKDRLN